MQVEAVRKWVDKLRSRNYKQCKWELVTKVKDELRFCSLGIAILNDERCRLEERFGMATFWIPEDKGFYNYLIEGLKLDDPIELVDPASDFRGLVCSYLIHLNDDEGKTFEQIADWLEEKYIPYLEAKYGDREG